MNAADRTVTTGDIIDLIDHLRRLDRSLLGDCASPSRVLAEMDRIEAVLDSYQASHPAQYAAAANRSQYGA